MLKVLAIATVALLANITPPSCGDTDKAQYRNARFGWTVSYPPSFNATPVDVQRFVGLNGVVISNFDGVSAHEGLTFRRFPADGVAFALLNRGGGPAPDTTPPEARFPLLRNGFTLPQGIEKAAPEVLTRGIVANGTEFGVQVWFGRNSSDASQEAIWNIVRSVRFPPQRTGTMSGAFYVLDDPSHYPVNSVVRVDGKPSSYVAPFYLVHAPGGFYALSWQPRFEPKCKMRFDRPHLQFYCAAARGRWDRMGRVLEGPESDLQYSDSLNVGQVKIGRDGQVLVGYNSTLSGGNSLSRYERRLWPSAR